MIKVFINEEPVMTTSLLERLSATRRTLIQYGTLMGVGATSLIKSGDVKASVFDGKAAAGLNPALPAMRYQTLGRTGHNSSRLIFGCGATLSGGRQDHLLNAAFDAGVNTFDVGFQHYYSDAEKNLAPFLQKHRDDIFLISKALVPSKIEWDEVITVSQAKAAAQGWLKYMDESLTELKQDHVDAYYFMGQNNVSTIQSEEMHRAFEQAKAQGKVDYLGLSTHQNAENVLAAAIETKQFDLAMIAITPGGWYDWNDRSILDGSPKMNDLRPLLDKARAAGMGLIGMKAGRFLAGRKWLGWGNPDVFNKYYERPLLEAKLSEFQRSYAFVLEHGLDAVNADMQTMQHLTENFTAAATSADYFADQIANTA
jgi:predicted aldo/keto reductase-like oxidoreductase